MTFVVMLSSCLCLQMIFPLPHVPATDSSAAKKKNMFIICIMIGFLLTLQRQESKFSVPLAHLSASRAYLKFHGDHSHAELIQTD